MMYNPRSPVKPERHLLSLIKDTWNGHPKFALLLGAGASVTSGIKSASEMVADWREKFHRSHAIAGQSIDECLSVNHWHNTADEYSYLFEILYDQPSQRREYIESCIGNAYPSWGYIYLVNLLRKNVFNVVLTTNFDDLINEACYQFSSDVRPMVCAHDSSLRSMRITSKRPKVIKIHGDFLFDNIKNTMRELESLEVNVRDKFKQIATEFGLIVVGYSGHDRSVMDSIASILKDESSFPHGIYWCVRNFDESKVSDRLRFLLNNPRVKFIDIDGFDQFFANLDSTLDLDPLPELSDPYGTLTVKLNHLLELTKSSESNTHEVIDADFSRLANKLLQMTQKMVPSEITVIDPDATSKIHVQSGDTKIELPLPYSLLAQIRAKEGDNEAALHFYKKQLNVSPNPTDLLRAFKVARKLGDREEISFLYSLTLESPALFNSRPVFYNDIAVELIHLEMYDEAINLLSLSAKHPNAIDENADIVKLNVLQIKKHKKLPFLDDEKQYLKNLLGGTNEFAKLGAYILLDHSELAIKSLVELHSKDQLPSDTPEWPIFKLGPYRFDAKGKPLPPAE